ncbi:hypothetical protein HK098_000221, partial [Nowakowskiella sp. JEL0407]
MTAVNMRIEEHTKKEEIFQRAVITAVHGGYQSKFQTAWEDEKRCIKAKAIPRDDFYEIGQLYESQWVNSKSFRDKGGDRFPRGPVPRINSIDNAVLGVNVIDNGVPHQYTLGPLTAEGRQWCRANNVCTFCHGKGHTINQCNHPDKLPTDVWRTKSVLSELSVEGTIMLSPNLGMETTDKVNYNPRPRLQSRQVKVVTLEHKSNKSSLNEMIPSAVEDVLDDEVKEDTTSIPIWSSSQDEKIFVGRIGKSAKSLDHVVNVLDDSGCMGMVMSASFAEKVGLETYRAESPTTVMFANSIITEKAELCCDAWVKIGKWLKRITFAILPISYDVIFGLPFLQSTTVTHENWKQRIKYFKSKQGTSHKWYGKGHRVDNLVGVVRLMAVKDITGIDEVFVVHIEEQFKATKDFHNLPYSRISVTTVSERLPG